MELHMNPAAHNIIPLATLRQTFFDDLDASSTVNPNRRQSSARLTDPAEEEQRMFQAFRADAMCRFAEHQRADDTAAVDDDSYNSVDTSHSASSPRHEALQPRRSIRAASFLLPDADHHDSGEVHVARPSCTVLANAAAGLLCGIALRRITAAVAGNIGAVVIGTQILCWMGYATVKWSVFLRDCASPVLHSCRPRREEPKNHPTLQHDPILLSLAARIPRRISFWAGVVVGVALLH
ncbi:putative FUN14 family [Leishmania naiffi]|uniref:FUN14 family n=1 Tax=Leishmania naiffi TaxID=5678 RepID=A0AAW3BHX3_9TRYP